MKGHAETLRQGCHRRPWRALALSAALSLSACEGQAGSAGAAGDDPVLAVVDGEPLHQSVVTMLMNERGLGEVEAREQALDNLRLAARYRQEHATDADPSPTLESLIPAARVDQLRSSALARIALKDIFEASHQASDVPSRIIAEHVDDPAIFHPRLQLICQVVLSEDVELKPGEIAFPPSIATDPEWWRLANEQGERLHAALSRYVPRISAESDCEWIRQVMARMGPPPKESRVRYKFETGAFESCNAEVFDADFVAKLCPIQEARWIPPFTTGFGVHVVGIIKVLEDTRSLKDDAKVRDDHLRALVLTDWRRAELEVWLARLREQRVVSIAEPGQGDDGDTPEP